MMRLFLALAALALVAATPQETLPGLESDGYYIEEGSSATEEVVSDAVFEGRADGGRLYVVVLAEEPPGGATTFSDSVLDLLDDGYVVTVAPETVGFAGDGSFWSAEEMNTAIDASLSGGSDDQVVARFTASLTGQAVGGGATPGDPGSAGGGIPMVWVLVVGAVLVAVWLFVSRRNREKRTERRLEEVRGVAREKLDEVANDILEMEDEVAVSEEGQVKMHYQRASKMYAQAMEDVAGASTIPEMLEVSEELDLAIWELDCAEALLDGKPMPPKPEPATAEMTTPPPLPEGRGPGSRPAGAPTQSGDFDRRPQRQSSGSNEMLNMLLAMMAMGGMRGGGFGGGFGGFRGGSGRSLGGGRRSMGGGGRIRGGGRRGG